MNLHLRTHTLLMDTPSRRLVLAAALCTPWMGASGADLSSAPLRIGLTPVFLDDQVAFLNQLRSYLEQRLLRPVAFVQRGSYREVVALLKQGNLDFAWLCGYPYVRNRDSLKLLAVPVYQGRPVYRSYLIVPASDSRTHSVLDLRGKVFAYSDPNSNSGYLFTQFLLRSLNERPESFFGKTFFTWAHRKVVEAVAVGLAQGGAVDGYVWDTLALLHPDLTARTSIVERSPEFGFPPIVASTTASAAQVSNLRDVLLGMHADAGGAALLKRLNLDGFEAGSPALYDSVAAMARVVAGD